MHSPKPITVGDKHFDSVNAAAKHYNIPPRTARSRLERGVPAEQAFNPDAGRPPFVVGSRTFASVSEAATHFKVPSQTVLHRLHRGWSPLQAVGASHPPETGGHDDLHTLPEAIRVNWQCFRNDIEAAAHFNVPVNLVRRQHKAGLTYEQIFGFAKNPSKRTQKLRATRQKIDQRNKTLHLSRQSSGPVSVKGMVHPSLRAAAEAHGQTETAVKKRLKTMSLEQALGLDPNVPVGGEGATTASGEKTVAVTTKKTSHGIEIAGTTYASLAAAAKAHNQPIASVKAMLGEGLSLETALGIAPTSSPIQPKTITVSGKEYPSIAQAAKAHGLKPAVVRGRLRRQQSIEQAFELTQQKTTGPIKPKPVTVHGQRYPSIKAAAQTYGLKPAVVRGRLRRGLSIEEALKTSLAPKTKASTASVQSEHTGAAQPKPISIAGKNYPSIKAAAEAYHLSPSLVRSRMRRGKSVEDAFELNATAKKEATKTKAQPSGRPNVGTGRTVRVGNKTYPSIKAAAEAHNLSASLVRGRLHRGMDIDKAFGVQLSSTPAKPVTVEGKTYPSIKAAAEANKVDYTKVRGRLHRGWTLAQALELKPHNSKGKRGGQGLAKPITVQGKIYPSIKAAAAHFNIDPALVRGRLHRGWNPNRAFTVETQPLGRPKGREKTKSERPHLNHPVTINKVPYPSIKAAANAHGIKPGVVRARLYRNWSVDEAFGVQPRKRRAQASDPAKQGDAKITLRGKPYPSIKAAADAHGLRPDLVRGRLHRGWTIDEAFELHKRNDKTEIPETRGRGEPVTVRGKTYPNISAAARTHSLGIAKVHGRLHRGWTLEEALELVKRQQAKYAAISGDAGLVVHGVRYSSLAAAADAYQIDPDHVRKAMRQGQNTNTAFDELSPAPKRNGRGRQGRTVVVRGETYASISSAARHYQVPSARLRHLIGKGLNPNQALSALLGPNKPTTSKYMEREVSSVFPATLDGHSFDSLEAMIKHYHLDPMISEARLLNGWTPKQLIGLAPPPTW